MAFDWSEYLLFARKISGEAVCCSEEAELRSAISRAYYAAFCCARNRARDALGFVPSGKGVDHQRVPEFYARRGATDIERWLKALRESRNTCDYFDTMPATSEGLPHMLSMAIADAQAVIGALEDIA